MTLKWKWLDLGIKKDVKTAGSPRVVGFMMNVSLFSIFSHTLSPPLISFFLISNLIFLSSDFLHLIFLKV